MTIISLLVGALGVAVAYFALSGGDAEDGGVFSAFTPEETATVDAGTPDTATEESAAVGGPGLPDPTLAREKYWEPSRDAGPAPDGYGTHWVHLERRLHRHFRRELGGPIELCLDEARRRGESFDGRLVFAVTGQPRRGLKMGFRLNGIRMVNGAEAPDADRGELPPDVYQCIWDTVEGTEVALPVTAAPLVAISQEPDLFIDWEIRDESPAGAVDVVDLGEPKGVEREVKEGAPEEAEEPAPSRDAGTD